MATQSIRLPPEFEKFAAYFVKSGRYPDATEVLYAAMFALFKTECAEAYDQACVELAEEGEASGLAEGDPFERIRAKYGFKSRRPE